jgi:hypothetical protein
MSYSIRWVSNDGKFAWYRQEGYARRQAALTGRPSLRRCLGRAAQKFVYRLLSDCVPLLALRRFFLNVTAPQGDSTSAAHGPKRQAITLQRETRRQHKPSLR